jgi:hypothetical protein
MTHLIRIFGDLSIHFWRHIAADENTQALELVATYGDRFLEEAWHVCEWRVLAGALCGDIHYAISTLDQGVGRGLWYPEAHLRREGMESLQGNPEFERLVALCAERQRAAEAATTPQLMTFTPRTDPPYPLLINIHRNHGTAERDRPYWHSLVEAGWAMAMPQSSRVMGPDVHIWNDRAVALPQVKAHYDALAANSTFDMNHVIWAGNMTGADVAMRLALSGEVAARGFIALSPYIPDVEVYAPLLDVASGRGIRGWLFIGADDTRCGPGTHALADRMRAADLPVMLHQHPDYTFGYPPGFDALLAEAVDFVMQAG